MKIEIKEVKTVDGKQVMQITTTDERWYRDPETDIYRPSSSWIASYYPKGVPFYKWLADKGWNESEAIKQAAGNRGTVVHRAIERLVKGQVVKIDEEIADPETGLPRGYTGDECEAILSFMDWYKTENPKRIISSEQVLISKEFDFAGTEDLYYEKQDGRIGNLDVKTSQYIWPDMELQLSSYRKARLEQGDRCDFTEILQVGYRMNKRKWKVTEVADKFALFQAARLIWAEENSKVVPKQREYPMELKLTQTNVSEPIPQGSNEVVGTEDSGS